MLNFKPILSGLLLIICFGSHIYIQAQDTLLTNNEVIRLSQVGLDKTLIIKKIQTSKTNFDLSIDALINLKKENIPDEIVAAMLESKNEKPSLIPSINREPNNPAASHSFGIYLFEDNKMTQLAPNMSAQNRVGGKVSAAFIPFGLGKIKLKANLPGTSAKIQLNTLRPVFYFYLDPASGGLNTSSGIPSTPNEFALIKFHIRSDNREITISKSNKWGEKGGLSDESVFQFDVENVGNGVFKITPTSDLKTGEYGFYLINSGNSNTGSAVGAKFFDFGIKLGNELN